MSKISGFGLGLLSGLAWLTLLAAPAQSQSTQVSPTPNGQATENTRLSEEELKRLSAKVAQLLVQLRAEKLAANEPVETKAAYLRDQLVLTQVADVYSLQKPEQRKVCLQHVCFVSLGEATHLHGGIDLIASYQPPDNQHVFQSASGEAWKIVAPETIARPLNLTSVKEYCVISVSCKPAGDKIAVKPLPNAASPTIMIPLRSTVLTLSRSENFVLIAVEQDDDTRSRLTLHEVRTSGVKSRSWEHAGTIETLQADDLVALLLRKPTDDNPYSFGAPLVVFAGETLGKAHRASPGSPGAHALESLRAATEVALFSDFDRDLAASNTLAERVRMKHVSCDKTQTCADTAARIDSSAGWAVLPLEDADELLKNWREALESNFTAAPSPETISGMHMPALRAPRDLAAPGEALGRFLKLKAGTKSLHFSSADWALYSSKPDPGTPRDPRLQ